MASTFSSSWSVTTVPTRSRAHVERLASSSAIRIYTSYSGTRSTGATDAPVGTRFKKCVLAATPSLGTLMQVEIGIVVGVLPPRPPLCQPGIEAGRYEPVGALLALGGADGEVVGVLVLGVVVVAADPAPLDRVPGGRLHQLLPQRQILDRAALAAPAARHPAGNPVVHPLDQVLGIGHVGDAGVAPLAVQPLERGDGARERHAIVGRVGGAFVEVPARDAVTGGGLDQRGVAAGVGRLGAVAEAALVGVDEDVDRRRLVRHLRAGSPPGYRCGAESLLRATRRRRWGGRARDSDGPRRTGRRTGSA